MDTPHSIKDIHTYWVHSEFTTQNKAIYSAYTYNGHNAHYKVIAYTMNTGHTYLFGKTNWMALCSSLPHSGPFKLVSFRRSSISFSSPWREVDGFEKDQSSTDIIGAETEKLSPTSSHRGSSSHTSPSSHMPSCDSYT